MGEAAENLELKLSTISIPGYARKVRSKDGFQTKIVRVSPHSRKKGLSALLAPKQAPDNPQPREIQLEANFQAIEKAAKGFGDRSKSGTYEHPTAPVFIKVEAEGFLVGHKSVAMRPGSKSFDNAVPAAKYAEELVTRWKALRSDALKKMQGD